MTKKQTLRMILPITHLPAFFPLLQRGVWLQVQVGCSISSLLTEQFGIDEEYIIERITTLFMDFKPIDDVETSYVKDGATLALSSAMPGLVGATMRRGGHLAAMRGDISHISEQREAVNAGRVKIKLFNMVMTELGERILTHGIYLTNIELVDLLSDPRNRFSKSSGVAILNGQQIDPENLKNLLSAEDSNYELFLKVEFKN